MFRRPVRLLLQVLALQFATSHAALAQSTTVTPTISLSANSGYLASPNYVRTGVPILFSGRILPADATGTVTFSVDGVPVQTTPVTPQTAADYIAVGDSITYAAYIADPAQRYQTIVGQALGLNAGTVASPGYTACDTILNNVIPRGVGNTTTSQPLYSVMIGANDSVEYGIGANEAVFDLCDQALLAWLGVPRQNKVLIGDPGVHVQSGAWANIGAFGNTYVNALTNTSGSGTLRFNLTTSGGAAYLWYLIQRNTPGSFTVSVDGGPAGLSTSTLFPASAPDNIPGSYALLRIPVGAGAHTFDITAQSGTVAIFGMGTAPVVGGPLPTVVSTDIAADQTPALAAATDEYNSDIEANISLLRGDGLDIRFAPTANYMFATPAEMMDSRHPNALGLSEIAQAVLAVITPANPANDNVSLAEATYTTGTLAAGGHTISAAYSGDTHNAPANAQITGFVLYDPTSTTTLTSDAALYPIQTSATLTAAVPNGNGLVNFIDQTANGNVLLGSSWMDGNPAAVLTVPSLSAGQHALVAQFLGDIYNAASTSPPLTVTVSGSYTTTALSSPATRYFAASPVALSAAIAPTSATGTVTFLDGATVLGHAGVVSGVASFNTSSLAPGIHLLTASFNGNATQDSSQSPALSIEIDPNPTTLALAPLPATNPYGTAVALTATVSPTAASGTVTLLDSFVAPGQTAATTGTVSQAALVNGVASMTSASFAPGTHAFTAVYAGDTSDLPSTSSPVSTQITVAATTTTLVPIPASATYGNALVLTATVTPAAATGTIAFTDSIGGTIAQVPLLNGAASFSSSALAPGSHILSASYSGDGFRSPSTSAALTTTIDPIASTIALAPLPATIDAGNPLSLSATISPASAAGTVLFRDANFGTLGQSSVSHGAATLKLNSPALGSYAITAFYSGDGYDTASASAAITTQVILTPTTTTLSASASSIAYGSPLTLNASLAPAAATGSVVFFDGSAGLGSALIVNGKASLNVSTLAVGSHSLHATYNGDPLDAASSSAALNATVTASATTTSLNLAQSSVIAGSPVIVNVRIASVNTAPSGTVSIRSGANILASGAVANASTGDGYATLSFSSATLGLGTFPLIASYSGDSDDQASDSSANPVSATVTAIPTTATLTLSAAQIPIQDGVTITVNVSATTPTPTGSIAFLNNGNSIGNATLNSSGAASFTLAPTKLGSFVVTAAYTPTGLYGATTSAPQSLTVTPPLAATLSPATLEAGPGTSGSATLALTPLSGFTGAIQTACQTSVSFVQCAVNAPASIGSGTLSVPVQVSVSKTTAGISAPSARGIAGAVLAMLLPLLARRKSRRALRLISVLATCALLMGGCAPDGGDFNSIPAGAQTVTVTVTAAGTSIASILTVNIAQ
jgi:hypothetical protein